MSAQNYDHLLPLSSLIDGFYFFGLAEGLDAGLLAAFLGLLVLVERGLCGFLGFLVQPLCLPLSCFTLQAEVPKINTEARRQKMRMYSFFI
jgi:hypothetical protein